MDRFVVLLNLALGIVLAINMSGYFGLWGARLLGPPAAPVPAGFVELKYDDGTPDGSQAIGHTPGTGYLVDYSPPSTPFTITKIRVLGNLYGIGYENLKFSVEIWDKDQKTVHSASYPHTKFTRSGGWVEIEVPEIMVDDSFYVHVFTTSPLVGGITISYDSSIENKHSEVTKSGKIDWWISIPKERINWMIRVIGNQATIPGNTEEKPTANEVELKYDSGTVEGSNSQSPGDISDLTINEKPITEGIELKYDDGTSDGSRTVGGLSGYVVYFSPPIVPFTIQEVRILAELRGTGYKDTRPQLEIWDKDFNVLYYRQEPYTSFSAMPRWIPIAIPELTVNNDFYIVFNTNSRPEGGVFIHYDSSLMNEHSTMRNGWNEEIPKYKTNWMIRVVGNTITDTTKITESTHEEIELKVGAHSSHFSSGYYVQLMVDDPNQTIRSADVTGPGIAGSISLTSGIVPGQWWSQPNVNFGTSPPALPLVYIFNITDKAGSRYVSRDEVPTYVHEFTTNLTPSGGQVITGNLVFTWTGINMLDVRYVVQLNDEEGNRIWDSPLTTATTFVYDGPILVPGNYHYFVSAHSQFGDDSLASETFKVLPP